MKLYSRQKCNWNCYAFFAVEVEETHWGFFLSNLWWQLGNGFIKVYDNVPDCGYAAENFNRYGEISIRQQLRLTPSPWEKALDLFAAEMNQLGVDWYLHGSAALALHGIDVAPKDVNVMIANDSDYDKVRNHFAGLAIFPFERCDNFVVSGLGTIYMEATIGIAFHNKELEPYDMSTLAQITRNGERIYLSTLEMLRTDNLRFGRIATVKKIEARLNITHAGELQAILSWFAQCCWPLIATASRDYLDGKIDNAALLAVMKEADQQCGSCGCEFDPLYKKVIAIIS